MAMGYRGKVMMVAGGINSPYQPVPQTWQSYLRRLGNGINGIVAAGGKTNFSQEDILANAQKYMQGKYPGNYQVEEYYNADKMKWDLRLKFEDPAEEMMWVLRWS